MQRSFAVFALLAIAAAAIGFRRADAPGDQLVLPGARAAIDAGQYPSIQAAIDALGESGGVVQLPPGVFEIKEPLRIATDDVTLAGSGAATHLKNVNVDGQPTVMIEPPKGKKTIWRVRLADLRITGNEKSGHGVWARRVDEIFLDGITVSYHGGHGILLDACYEDPRVCDSLISYNKKDGLSIDRCHDIVVSANHFEENFDAVTCRDSFNLTMTGNNLDDHLGSGVIIEKTYGSVVSGNMIEECQGTGVILDRDCYGITLSSNVIAHDFGGGIDLRDAHGCAVSANTFVLCPRKALAIGPDSGRITVTGNNFCDSNIGGSEFRKPDDRTASGIVLEGATDVAIVGNVFSGLDGPAIEKIGAANLRIHSEQNVVVETD